MPTTPTYPGVYIEEVPSPVRTIVGVSTSVAAFIGYFKRGPLNAAVRIFSMGDFEREYGGLQRDSETSYAIQQFFLNGGTEAWVVRVALGQANAALTIQDIRGDAGSVFRVHAGRRIRGKDVEDPGQWGNALRLEVDYDTAQPNQRFNLTISEVSADGRTVLRTETFSNLSMTEGDDRNAIEVVNERSRLVQLVAIDGWTPPALAFPGPAATGTLGRSITRDTEVPDADSHITVTVNAEDRSVTLDVTLDYGGMTVDNLRAFVPQLQAAIRRAGVASADRLLAGAIVKLLMDGDSYRIHVAADRVTRTLYPSAIITFSNATSDTTADDLGLSATTGATVNVQQYRLGEVEDSSAYASEAEPGADGSLPNAAALLGNRDDKTGLYALRDVDLFNILCVPRAADLPVGMSSFMSAALDFCEERRAIMIVDIPEEVDTVPAMETWMAENDTLRHANAAVYFPRPRIADPLNDYRLKNIAASGTIAGLCARTDTNRGVWKAPAGTEASLRGVQELAYKLTDPENGVLNPLGINCLRTFPVYGNICWGARTLMGSNVQASEWKYLPVRRLALFMEESLYRGTQWVVFEPNDEPLWSQIRLNVGAFMHRLFRQGAFQGSSPREAYFVKCDKETTTQDDINQGIVNILVGFAPLKPAEFVIIKISQIAGQIPT